MTQTARPIDAVTARRVAVHATLLAGPPLAPAADSIVKVARHFGGIQIDPTRTVERTQHLVLWSRIRDVFLPCVQPVDCQSATTFESSICRDSSGPRARS